MYQSPFCPLLPIKWMLCKKALFFPTTCVCILCVCILFISHTPKAKTQNLFFLLGLVGNIICKRDRWWVYWLLIVYTLLLPWQFSILIYIFFRNVEIFNFFSPSKKKILKENIEHSRKFYLVEMIFQFIYLFIWQTLVQLAKVLQYMILLLDARINRPPPKETIWRVLEKKFTYSNFLFLKMGLINECNL